MGQAIIKADIKEVNGIIQEWVAGNNFTLSAKSGCAATEDVKFIAKSNLLRATWKYQSDKLSMTLLPRTYLTFLFHITQLCGLLYCVFLIEDIIKEYAVDKLLFVVTVLIPVILLTWWYDSKLLLKFIKIEKTFWDITNKNVDFFQLTSLQSDVYSRKYILITEIPIAIMAVYICTVSLGVWGLGVSAMLCSFAIIMRIARLMHNNNPQWNWRFWIIGNMEGWTVLMICMLSFFLVFLSMEVITPLKLYKNENNPFFVIQTTKSGLFRDITPATSNFLEKDGLDSFYELADNDFVHLKETEKENLRETKSQWIKTRTNSYCIGFFILTIVTVYCFPFRSLCSLLQKQKTWKSQIVGAGNQSPFVPYISQAWKWATPQSLCILIFLHWIIGGIFNIAATALCIEGLSYLLMGETLLFAKTANVWSWLFIPSKNLFGAATGQIIGAAFVIAIIMPILLLITAFIRRIIKNIHMMTKSIAPINDEMLSGIYKQIRQLCFVRNIKAPKIILSANKFAIVKLHHLPIIGHTAIELSKGTIDLLSPEELKAVIAHEIGHIKQGLWRITLLKYLSSIALFPNHYLTLCIDWPRNEMDADSFALDVTKNPHALKNALIKISTAQTTYLALNTNVMYLTKFIGSIKRKVDSLFVSVNFYFGDGLLGYTHPYLSERLQAIDANSTQEI